MAIGQGQRRDRRVVDRGDRQHEHVAGGEGPIAGVDFDLERPVEIGGRRAGKADAVEAQPRWKRIAIGAARSERQRAVGIGEGADRNSITIA
jgi:hypothetical protein